MSELVAWLSVLDYCKINLALSYFRFWLAMGYSQETLYQNMLTNSTYVYLRFNTGLLTDKINLTEITGVKTLPLLIFFFMWNQAKRFSVS